MPEQKVAKTFLTRFSLRFHHGRAWLRSNELLTLEILLPLMLIISLTLCGCGFFFGKSVCAFYFHAGFFIAALAASLHSFKRLLYFLLSTAGILLFTAYTFSYTGTDAMCYHLPMQRLLIDGWNPVFDSSIEKFQTLVDGKGILSPYHTLFLPKVSALCGAIVAKGCGLWCADAMLGWTLLFTLFCSAFRFAKIHWPCSHATAFLFAFSLTGTTKITSFLAGHVDYTAYAGFMIAVLGCFRWMKTAAWSDLVSYGIGLFFCMLAKTTGFVCGMLLLCIGFLSGWRKSHYYWFVTFLLALVFVIGAAPLLTAWIQYGSPFYPSMTFSSTIPIIDITSDFRGNPDGEQMGYFARICYAWFSQTLAVKGCAWWYSSPDFAPAFYVASGVSGLGTWFRILMVGSSLALLCSKKNSIFWLSVFIFITANLAPLKYIGYNRYFPQIWAFPFLAAYNLLYACRWHCPEKLLAIGKPIIFTGIALLLLPIQLRTFAYQARALATEGVRQALLTPYKGQKCKLPQEKDLFTVRERLAAAGIEVSTHPEATPLEVNQKLLLVGATEDLKSAETLLCQSLPLCDTFTELFAFQWQILPRHFPRPLFLKRNDLPKQTPS